ncbi:FliO/MopB family protein [Sandaracinobacter neustonicus]|uniref:FliO/MopB family protein n=1 Tax=Sandaracinobacter neustonicus TaxID=1715348 RepID=A0A501XHX4_9SPHN|nr:flagellar biosynthetic protein FliO [Sandaracinobacter neustonicus]TPE60140.1 FliO/MopB family protein [Sandaracinobacter neustonicus]
MFGEFLLRLAVALPLVCALATLSLWAVKRGWFRLPPIKMLGVVTRAPQEPPPLDLIATRSLGPGARLAVVRFDGRDHLVGQSGNAFTLIASTVPQEQPPCAS